MNTIDIINYLQLSNLFNGWAFTDWRDDSSYPFDQNINVCLIRIGGGNQDADIGNVGVDLYLHTDMNASTQVRGELLSIANQLDSYLVNNSTFENVQYVELSSSKAGPFKDAQERYFTTHRITLKRSGV